MRRILGTRRIGHVGTLDPLATGVLPLVVGKATRLASLLSAGDKVYSAVFLLGTATDTYDTTGEVISTEKPRLDLARARAASCEFVGTFQQTPPTFSAKKIGGVRAYRLARRRQPVEPAPVEVTVKEFEVEALDGDRLRCRVTCAPGFYVRALAHDLGKSLGCGGCLEKLRREQSGAFTLNQAVTLDQLGREDEAAAGYLLPMGALLPELPSVFVTPRGSRLVAHGNSIAASEFAHDRPPGTNAGDSPRYTGAAGGKVKVYDQEGVLLAIAEGQMASVLHPRIVLV
jgi:tRNA pseudouridine55 synthase